MWNSHNSLCTFEMASFEITMFLLLQSWDSRHLLPPKHRTTKLYAEPFFRAIFKAYFRGPVYSWRDQMLQKGTF